jgi:hypothetical protein
MSSSNGYSQIVGGRHNTTSSGYVLFDRLTVPKLVAFAREQFKAEEVDAYRRNYVEVRLLVNGTDIGYETLLDDTKENEKTKLLKYIRSYKIKKYNEHRR